MKLYLFPESAELNNGYGIAVEEAYKRLAPKENDIIVWYTNSKNIPYLRDKDLILRKSPMASFARFELLLKNRPTLELRRNLLRSLQGAQFSEIHCDDVLFYKVIRKMFPNQHLVVRFHNCFARINDRRRLLNIALDWKFRLNLHLFSRLEREIFCDKKVTKIFLTKEDCEYYRQMVGRYSDSEVWPFYPDIDKMEKNRKLIHLENKLVWLGGVQAHKKKSIEWFIAKVFPSIQNEIPNCEFHLWGAGTDAFNNPSKAIFGHGFYEGDDLPLENRALYINPDIVGGGIKLKLLTLLEAGVPFVSTVFGFEGYDKFLIDNRYCYVSEDDEFGKTIVNILNMNVMN